MIPKTSQWKPNWLEPDLNNFRQNVPGTGEGQDIADLTAGVAGYVCSTSSAELHAPICNRGSAPIGAGVKVGFYDGTTKVCEAVTSKALQPGECEEVTCTWTTPPTNGKKDINVIADDGGENSECKEGNNQGTIFGVQCQPPA